VVEAAASMDEAVVIISHLFCQLSCFLMAQFMFEQVSLRRNPYLNEKISRIQLPSSILLLISGLTSRIQPIILHIFVANHRYDLSTLSVHYNAIDELMLIFQQRAS
jgi:hypothetical protein